MVSFLYAYRVASLEPAAYAIHTQYLLGGYVGQAGSKTRRLDEGGTALSGSSNIMAWGKWAENLAVVRGVRETPAVFYSRPQRNPSRPCESSGVPRRGRPDA